VRRRIHPSIREHVCHLRSRQHQRDGDQPRETPTHYRDRARRAREGREVAVAQRRSRARFERGGRAARDLLVPARVG
jgi:hypothetical protein